MKKIVLMALGFSYSCFLLTMDITHEKYATNIKFSNKLNIDLKITINDKINISLRPQEESNNIELSSTDRDFIKKIEINTKTYNKENSVINDWNWKIAQAASCGPEADPHFQKPLFSINDFIQKELDLANEIISKGEKQSLEEKILISDSNGSQFMQKGGIRYPYHPYHSTDKTDIKIINFVNQSKQKIVIDINDNISFELSPQDKQHGIQVKSNFSIKKLTIQNHSFTEGEPEILWFNNIIKKIFPGHFCNINITNEFLDALGKPWNQEVTFINATDQKLSMIINDSLSFVLYSKQEGMQAIEESYTPRTESASPTEEGSLSPRTPRAKKSRIKIGSISHTLSLIKDINGIYIKTLAIDGECYTNDNKTIQALNKRIATLEFFDNKIEIDAPFLKQLQKSQTQLTETSSSSCSKRFLHQRTRSRSMPDKPIQNLSSRSINPAPTQASSSSSRKNVVIPPLALSPHHRLRSINPEEETRERSPRTIDLNLEEAEQ